MLDVSYAKIWQQVQHQNNQLRSVLAILMGIVLVVLIWCSGACLALGVRMLFSVHSKRY